MNRIAPILLISIVASLNTGVNAQFFKESNEYQNLARKEYVDVFFEYSEHESGTTGSISDGKEVPRGLWDSAEKARKRVVCQSPNYKVIANLEKPSVEEFHVGDFNFFAKEGMVLQMTDKQGNVYSSRFSPVKARQNTWRAFTPMRCMCLKQVGFLWKMPLTGMVHSRLKSKILERKQKLRS